MIWTHGSDSLEGFVYYFNSGHDSIKVEVKWDMNEIPHLDMLIYKGPEFESTGHLSSLS